MRIYTLIKQIICGLRKNHNFVLTDDNYWGYEGDARLHQYTCTNCGRHDYLWPEKDRNKDWNGGKGDGELCHILFQESHST